MPPKNARMAKKQSAKKAVSKKAVSKKSSHPPSGIGARFATAEALASPRSNPAGILSNRVAAPKSWFPSPKLAAPKPAPTPQTRTAVLHTVQHRRRLSPLADRRAKMRIKLSHQSPSLQPLPFSAASSEKSSPRCLPSPSSTPEFGSD